MLPLQGDKDTAQVPSGVLHQRGSQVQRVRQRKCCAMADTDIEQTLIICREAVLYKIPPRASSGHKSGDWLVSDKIFSGRVRVIAKGETAEVRIEDPSRRGGWPYAVFADVQAASSAFAGCFCALRSSRARPA